MGIIAIVAIRANMAIICITDIFAITAIIIKLVFITIVSYKACYVEEATTKIITDLIVLKVTSTNSTHFTPTH